MFWWKNKIREVYPMNRLLLPLCCLLFLCCNERPPKPDVLYHSPTYTNNGAVRMIVEIPAGTNHKIEYFPDTRRFQNDTLGGRDRIIDFLPYPGNYGYVPSTLMDKNRGGDGDALDILCISESVPTGTVLEVIPIATLLLRDRGEIDTKIIAVPANPANRTLQTEKFTEFLTRYDGAKRIIQDWFLNYKGLGTVELEGWRDDEHARREIKKWAVSTPTETAE